MLELINVKKVYTTVAGETAAMNGVSVKFPDSGMVFVIGKSGSGKTTLLNVVGGLDGFDSGEIIIDGKNFSTFTPSDYDSYRNTFVGFIFQEYNLLPDYTVEKNIKIANELQGKASSDKVIANLMKEFDIAGLQQRKPNELSGGQKQRVAIVRSLVKEPKIIMADEPTGALDSATGIQVMETLKKLSKEKLVMIVSHDLELAEKYADRIIRLVDGQIVEDVTLTDKEIESNIHVDEVSITVKSGASLNPHETEELLKAIREKKKISFTEKFSARHKEKTKEVKVSNEVSNIELINSKMKYKSSAELGLKSLKVKPVRLIVTILLSVIAFAVFGVFDTVAAYSGSRAIQNLLKTSDYNAIPVDMGYYNNKEEWVNYKISQEKIDYYNKETGYNFRPVYDIDDRYGTTTNQIKQIEDLEERSAGGKNTIGYHYFENRLTGFIEFKNSEIKYDSDGKAQIIDENGFNLKLVCGDLPKLVFDQNGVLVESENSTLKNIAISEYLATSIIYWRYPGNVISPEFVKEKIIGEEVMILGKKYVIKGVYNCGEIPEKYDELLSKPYSAKPDALANDLLTYLNSGLYFNIYVGQGYIDWMMNQSQRRTGYYSFDNTYDVVFSEIFADPYKIKPNTKFYNYQDIEKSKVILFDADRNNSGTYELKEDEVLLHIDMMDYILYLNERVAIANGEDSKRYAEIKENIDIFNRSGSAVVSSTLTESVEDYINIIKKVMISNGEANPDVIKKIRIGLEKKLGDIYKVVGIYVSVDTDLTKPYGAKPMYPVVMNKKAIEKLGIYAEQGDFGKMIAPKIRNSKGAKIIAKDMTIEDGVRLNWSGNEILKTINRDAEFISQFTQLFLYVALVLALFSVFMLYNYIATSIVSKRQSIGVLRALGSGGKDIFLMFITESVVIAFIIGVFASILAYVGCIFVNFYIKNIMNLVIDFAVFGIRQVIVIMLTSLLTAVVSSLIPIIKISKEKPVKLIREP